MYQPTYLQYMNACDRFLMEASENDEDLVEASPEDGAAGGPENAAAPEADAQSDGGETPVADMPDVSANQDLEDAIPGDSDSSPASGDSAPAASPDAPAPEQMNAQQAAPGAINPLQLYTELTEGKTDIRDAVVSVLLQEYPNKQCTGKDMLRPIARAVTAYMKHHNYAPLPKNSMEALCFRIAEDIIERSKRTAKTPKQASPDQQDNTSPKPMGESAWKSVGASRESCFSLMEMWNAIEGKPLTEGTLGKTAAAMTLAGAGMAGAATADSAPISTLMPTPRYQAMYNATSQHAAAPSADYKLSREDAKNIAMANGVPKSNPQDTIAPGQKAPGDAPASTTQADVKEQVKSGKTTTQIAVPDTKSQSAGKVTAKSKDSGKCSAGSPRKGNGEGAREAIHTVLHHGADKVMQAGEGVVTGLKDGLAGLAKGFSRGWNSAAKKNAAEHKKFERKQSTK